MRTSAVLAVAMAGNLAAAIPTKLTELAKRQGSATPSCYTETTYKVDSQDEKPGDWTAVSGDTCTSSTVDGCAVGKSNSVTLGVTVTVGAGIDVGEVFHLDTSVAWSYSETKTETVTQNCPKGGYVCGLIYKPTWMHVKGKKTETYQGSCVYAGEEHGNEQYEFDAPLLINGKAEIQYAACISDASKNQDTAAVGIDKCPEGL